MNDLVRAAQERLQARLVEPTRDELDDARAAAIAAARAAFVAVEGFRAFLAPIGEDWTSRQPGAAERAAWRGYSTGLRVMLTDLGAFGQLRQAEPEPGDVERELPAAAAMTTTPAPVLGDDPPFRRGQATAGGLVVLDCRRHPALGGAWAIQVAGHAGEPCWLPAAGQLPA